MEVNYDEEEEEDLYRRSPLRLSSFTCCQHQNALHFSCSSNMGDLVWRILDSKKVVRWIMRK